MNPMLEALYMFLITFSVMFIATWFYRRWALRRGLLAPDVRKKGNPMVPKWGGLVISLYLALLPLLFSLFGLLTETNFKYILAFVLSGTIGFIVGVLDDLHFKKWDMLKIVAVSFSALPIILLNVYIPRPILPFVGRLRLTILYPLLIFLAFSIVPNGMNMLDLVNGVMLFSQILLIITIAVWTWILGYIFVFQLSITTLALVLALYVFNRYPAKLFVSNVGSYTTGVLVTALVVFSRMEYVLVILLLPMILNSFSLLATIRGILTREEIKEVRGQSNINEDGLIYPNPDPKAPMNLVRMIVLHDVEDEARVIKIINTLFIFSTILANITAFLIYIIGV